MHSRAVTFPVASLNMNVDVLSGRSSTSTSAPSGLANLTCRTPSARDMSMKLPGSLTPALFSIAERRALISRSPRGLEVSPYALGE